MQADTPLVLLISQPPDPAVYIIGLAQSPRRTFAFTFTVAALVDEKNITALRQIHVDKGNGHGAILI